MALCPNSVTIDDFNDNIVYSGPWQAFTNQTYGFNGTRHVANTPGLSANFKFNGSCLFVNGIVGTNNTFPMPPTTFILDGHFTQMNLSVTDGETFPGTRFAQSVLYIALSMSEGEHELIITDIGGNSSNPLQIDGFIITPLQQTNTSSSSAPLSTSTTSSSTSSTAVPTLTSSSASATPTIALASTSSSHSHTGAIVGGVVGGVGGFLVLAALGFLALRYFSKRKGGPESDIRPFAAWRGGNHLVLPTAASSDSQGVAAYAEKHPQPPAPRAPDSGPTPRASGDVSAEPNAPGPAPHPNERFYTASKTRPPNYAP